MNAKLTALFVTISLIAGSLAQAGEAIGPAKARGDYRGFYQSQTPRSRSVTRSRPVYRYSTPGSAPVIVQTPVIREVPGPVVAQAPAPDAARRFSQAPAAETQSAAPAQVRSNAGRRFSYAPTRQYSSSPVRRYSGNVGHGSRPNWSLNKTDSGKYNSR